MKILLIGANGQLGHDLQMALKHHHLLSTARSGVDDDSSSAAIALDVTNTNEVRSTLHSFAPEAVVNCAAFHRVDDIEKDVSQALAVNAYAAHQLALACREVDAALMHISTDYVFDGAKRTPYVESDLPNPLSAYGASKAAGESLIRAAWPKHYIVRTCGLYGIAGASGKGGNFVNTMLRLAKGDGVSPAGSTSIRVVGDQTCTPTFTQDLARQLAALLETGVFGLYHITSDGETTWHDFAAEIFRIARLKPDLQPTTSVEFNAPAKRPPYSVLENRALKSLSIDCMRPWREALADYLEQKLG